MTKIQVRVGDQSVIVSGDQLLLQTSGVFRVIAEGDWLVLEAATLEPATEATQENAEPAFDTDAYRHATGALRQQVSDLESRNEAQAKTIKAQFDRIAELEERLGRVRREADRQLQGQQQANESLRATLDNLEKQIPEHGDNFWNNTVQSDRKTGVTYRVSLYRLLDGSIRGICQCMDYHLWGLGQLNFAYKCKHIQREEMKARNTAYAANTRLNGR